ncbi:hypothetical protein I553_0440 [Mycobacterium xenopi 4042]|uniref:Alpha/beta hydrolase n=1 Tax=Mycobacterium xenopi 4042 TaxID=1299334 RepID=X7YIF4_MYCXE|nr:hypothetical protein I553_0440 [Mycobacterium xenopi 4042]
MRKTASFPAPVQPVLHHLSAPETKMTTLEGLGHIPMFEAPGRITEVITDFLEEYSPPIRAISS